MKNKSQFVLLFLLLSCGDSTNYAEVPIQCTPASSDSGEIIYEFSQRSKSGRSPVGEHLLMEKGSIFFYLDSHCHYWVKGNIDGDIWEDNFHGVLDIKSLETINTIQNRIKWTDYNEKYISEKSSFDAPTWNFYNEPYSFQFNCIECKEIRSAIDKHITFIDELKQSSQAYRAPKILINSRLLSEEQGSYLAKHLPVQSAPEALDLNQSLITLDTQDTAPLLVQDASTISALEEMVELYKSEEHIYKFKLHKFILMKYESQFYAVYYRYVLPFE